MSDANAMDRRAAVKELLAERGETLVVSGLGSPSYDVFAAGDDEKNFYLWGAMGGAAMMGLGLALAQPDRPVVVVTGDGEQLMGIGALMTIAVAKPANLTIVVLDNGHYGETGMQRSHTGHGIEIDKVAAATGIASTRVLASLADVAAYRRDLQDTASGPRLARLMIAREDTERRLPPRDGVHLKNRFRQTLGLEVN